MSEGEHPDRDSLNLLYLLDPRNRPLKISLEEAQRRIANAVYEATDIVERLEGAGLIWGNGHHIRQNLAQMASDTLKERWNEQESNKKD